MTFDDDADFLRRRMQAADPAGPAPSADEVSAARSELVRRLDHPSALALSDSGRPTSARRRVLRVAAPLAAAAALVTGVLVTQPFSSTQPAGAAVALAAANATQQAESAHAQFTVTFGSQTVSGDGVADIAKSTGHFSLHLPEPIGDVQLILGGNDLYLTTPPVAKSLVGKDWIRVDRASLDALSQAAGGSVLPSQVFDPTNVLAYLRGVSNDLAKVGTEDVRGAATTHYAGHIDPARLAAQIPDPNARDTLGKAAAAAKQSVPVDIWVDDQSRLRKLTVSVDLSKAQTVDKPAGSGPSGVVTATVELWDFGAAADTTPPPADQVSDAGPIVALLNRLHG
jgi:hypothetical protein